MRSLWRTWSRVIAVFACVITATPIASEVLAEAFELHGDESCCDDGCASGACDTACAHCGCCVRVSGLAPEPVVVARGTTPAAKITLELTERWRSNTHRTPPFRPPAT